LVVVQVGMLAMFTLLAQWWVYFVLYVLPLSTMTSFFEAIRSFSEHVLPGKPTNKAEENRRFYMNAGPVERFSLASSDSIIITYTTSTLTCRHSM
jgi:hypothetical protein